MAASQPCDESEPWMFYKCLIAKPHCAGLVFAMLDGLNVFLKTMFSTNDELILMLPSYKSKSICTCLLAGLL